MTDWRIRQAGPEDAEQILAADVFDGPARRAAVLRMLGRPGAPDPRSILMLAERDGRTLGFASGTVLDHPDKPPSLFVQEVGVNEDERRMGIATALVGALRAAGRARGCAETWVLTEDANTAARAAYAAMGGRETPGVVMFDWDESGA